MEPYVPLRDGGLVTFVLDIILLVVCWPTVIARFVVRMRKSTLGLDDWLMGIGMVMTTIWSGLLIIYCFSGGGWEQTDPRISDELLAQALKYYFICQTFYCATTVPIKVSICVALLRISGTVPVYKVSLYIIIGIAIVAGFGATGGIAGSCTPPEAFWNPAAGTCNALVNAFFAYFISACSIITDFAMAILPAFMLWKIQMRRSIKVSVGILLGMAAVASCATIVRLRYLMALLDSSNFLKESSNIAIWTVVELLIGIFAGSVPALRPLLRYVPFLSHESSEEYGQSGRGKTSSHVKMDTLKGGTYVEAVRNLNEGRVTEDGDSQEYILHDRDGKSCIRKDISVTLERTDREQIGRGM